MNVNALKNVSVVIPSLNPNYRLIEYVKELMKIGFSNIIIVNDGSAIKYDSIFMELGKKEQCIVLKHAINQGKGRALKTAFHYYLNKMEMEGIKDLTNYGIVTADADGQHSPIDTYKIAESLFQNKDNIVLGSRNFNELQVPFKSKFGNKITTLVFGGLYGRKTNDTQTGLRGIPSNLISSLLDLNGENLIMK